MILYHGTVYVFEKVDPLWFEPNKDFGLGFYTTTDIEQAKKFALRLKRIKRATSCHVYAFELKSHPLLQIKNFFGLNNDWFDYVEANRHGKTDMLIEDVIIGPVTDDNVGTTLSTYELKLVGGEDRKKAKEIALEDLKLDVYTNQVVLKTPLAWKEQLVPKGVVWNG